MASPLPEPFTLVDILGDGEILTCRAELRGEEVLVHVLPADPAARDRVIARIARLPRNPNFLDRIDHQGHSLLVTRPSPELERFEAWLDEVSPEGGSEPAGPPPQGDATRLVLSIREHVGAKTSGGAAATPTPPSPEPESEPESEPEAAPAEEGEAAQAAAASTPEPTEEPTQAVEAPVAKAEEGDAEEEGGTDRGSETVLMDMSEGVDLPPAGPPADEHVTPPMLAGMIGVPAAWTPDDEEAEEEEDEEDEPRTVEMSAPDPATLEPQPSPVREERGAGEDPPTMEPGPSPLAEEAPPTREPAPSPAARGDEAPTRPVEPPPPPPAKEAARPQAPAAPAPASEEGEGTRRRTQLFLSMPPAGYGSSSDAAPPPPPPPPAAKRPAPRKDTAAASRPAPKDRPSPAPATSRSSGGLQWAILAAAAVVVAVVLAVWVF